MTVFWLLFWPLLCGGVLFAFILWCLFGGGRWHGRG